MAIQRLFALLGITLIITLTACVAQTNTTPPQPPATRLQSEIESDLSNPPWWWSMSQFVYAIQEYCAYTDECDTKHVWLGATWGYNFPSYLTTVYGNSITINDLYEIHMNYDGRCPEGQNKFETYQFITAQAVLNAEGNEIPYFCVEKKIPNRSGERLVP